MAHMNIEDREIIEEMIKKGERFTKIGEKINHHRTTISDEIIKDDYFREFPFRNSHILIRLLILRGFPFRNSRCVIYYSTRF